MSSRPGFTLESFVMWNHDLIVDGDGSANKSLQIAEVLCVTSNRLRLSKEQFAPVLALYEQFRDRIENKLLDFDDELQSWRDYAGFAFDFIPNVIAEDAGVMIANSV